MLKKIKFEALFIGFILLALDIFSVWGEIDYLNNDSKHHRVVSGIDDTFIGDIFYFVLFILSLSIISYSLSFNNKFSKFGKYFYLKIYIPMKNKYFGLFKNLPSKEK